MTVQHSERAHATWSASATARNVQCPGALALGQGSSDEESIHAARGTAGHEVGEKCLRGDQNAVDFLGDTIKTKKFSVEIDEEIVDSAQQYIDYVRQRAMRGTLLIEQKFKLDDLDPPFDAGGTGDAVVYIASEKLLEIIDFKHGTGRVEAAENPQLRTYGLGALLANPGLDVERVKTTIVQPRAWDADDQTIRSEELSVADLVEWTAELLEAMHRSKQAEVELDACGGNSVLFDEWCAKWLRPGKCTFCPVEGTCPALRKQALDVAKVWFDNDDQPQIGNAPDRLSPEELAKTLDMLGMLSDWSNAVRAYAKQQAEGGVAIPGYQLSETIGHRKWTDEAAVVASMIDSGLTKEEIYATPKLKSPAQMEKALGAKRKALVDPLTIRPVTGVSLVSAEKTSRPPVPPAVENWFEKEK